jgi:hypothetical protein
MDNLQKWRADGTGQKVTRTREYSMIEATYGRRMNQFGKDTGSDALRRQQP